jgi:hypothetical protein
MSTVFPIFFCFIRRKVFRVIYWQNLSVADATAPLPRGASGEEGKLSDMPKPPLDRGAGTASAVTERFIQKEPPSRILSTKAALLFTLSEL